MVRAWFLNVYKLSSQKTFCTVYLVRPCCNAVTIAPEKGLMTNNNPILETTLGTFGGIVGAIGGLSCVGILIAAALVSIIPVICVILIVWLQM